MKLLKVCIFSANFDQPNRVEIFIWLSREPLAGGGRRNLWPLGVTLSGKDSGWMLSPPLQNAIGNRIMGKSQTLALTYWDREKGVGYMELPREDSRFSCLFWHTWKVPHRVLSPASHSYCLTSFWSGCHVVLWRLMEGMMMNVSCLV